MGILTFLHRMALSHLAMCTQSADHYLKLKYNKHVLIKLKVSDP